MIELLFKGGKTMIPLFLCSFVAVTIIIERFICLKRKNVVPQQLKQLFEQDAPIDRITAESANISSSLSTIIMSLNDCMKREAAGALQVLHTLYKKEIQFMERGLGALEVIASITPLLGLLGTVLGMVDVFNVIAEIGVGQASALSSGIAKALITTIVGLSIAIPTLVFHSYFSKVAEEYALDLEEYSQAYFRKVTKRSVN